MSTATQTSQLDIQHLTKGKALSLKLSKIHTMLLSTKTKHELFKSQKEDLELNIYEQQLPVTGGTQYLGV